MAIDETQRFSDVRPETVQHAEALNYEAEALHTKIKRWRNRRGVVDAGWVVLGTAAAWSIIIPPAPEALRVVTTIGAVGSFAVSRAMKRINGNRFNNLLTTVAETDRANQEAGLATKQWMGELLIEHDWEPMAYERHSEEANPLPPEPTDGLPTV